jgi:hypothetical protein
LGGITSFEGIRDDAHGLSDGTVWAIGHTTIRGGTVAEFKNHWAAIDVHQGNELRVKMLSIGADVPPPGQPPAVGSSTAPNK